MCNLNDMGYPKHESPKRRMRRPSEKGIYDSTKGNLLTSVGVGVGTTQPEDVVEAVPCVVPGTQTCYTIHGPFRDIATRKEAKKSVSDFILIILKAASF